jgi:hypothetical protein
MKHEEKINYMKIALGICSFSLKIEDIDLIVSIYDLVLDKKGEANISEVFKIQQSVKDRYKTKV